ncbi:MAG: NUDIX hydrolase [Candidatus Melainabacteria bacterium]|nr:NUDIX hydrolase [Candidatus Melainabacteria bacterium]
MPYNFLLVAIDEVIDLIKRRFTPKKRTIPNTRISVVVLNKDGEILLVRHKKGNQRYWVLPGGRLEYGETFEECAVREVKEETGLDVEMERFLYLSEAIAPDRSRHIVNIFIKAKVTGGTMKLGDEPVLAGVEFVKLEELAQITLFPPVSDEIIETLSRGSNGGIQFLGNLWV